MTFTFEKAEIPAKARSGRTPLPNPFKEQFPADTEALVFTVAEGRNSKEARRVLRQIRQAAKACGRTGRADFEDQPDGSLRVKAWTVAPVTRKTKVVTPAPAKAPAKKAAAKKTAAARRGK